MNIAGLQKMTLLDFPARIACTVFLPGCNLRCPFCHNASLVLPDREKDNIPENELFAFLSSRRKKLDGVCVTGGEPTLYIDLPDMLRRIKDLGFQVKLDTNGTNPGMLEQIVADGLCDYVAMDIKNSPQKYTATCGGIDVLENAQKSAAILMQGHVDYEFRTTVMHPFHTPGDLTAIGQWLQGAKRYFIQNFVDSGDLLSSGCEALTEPEMKELLDAVQEYIPSAKLRGL
ncbi:MAG: anaerobic ribonucleoside-triphosphate reductase activating protein [Oscillospiraceae bacterium]|nr:anaerobic ribonucleoside-triphosphate reductase activating protein [Oscillospiraceae bacterium]